MSSIVIKVESLSKQYRIGAKEGYKTFRETLVDAAKNPFVRLGGVMRKGLRAKRSFSYSPLSAPRSEHSSQDDTIWALKDISFEVKRGEIVGVIGRNGAGKSTLLKILSKITEPTKGRVELRGRVGSLLEVGTGFHPELTGHENVYLYGAILGMDRWEVTRKFDEIIAFAELEKFVDTPVKRYSSGMYMRLAFAVAAHLEPEILLVDEVLAVGDAAFQKKCLGKMEDVSREGRTVLFVSHNLAAVSGLCDSCIQLDSGAIANNGDTDVVVNNYLRCVMTIASSASLHQREDRSGSGKVSIVRFHIEDSKGNRVNLVRSGQTCVFVFGFKCSDNSIYRNVSMAFGVMTHRGEFLFRNFTGDTRQDFSDVTGCGQFRCLISRLPLAAGIYTLGFRVVVNGEESDYIGGNAASFKVEKGDFFQSGIQTDHAPVLVEHTWCLEVKTA